MEIGEKAKKVKRRKDRPYEAEKGERNKEKMIKEVDKKEKETINESRIRLGFTNAS